MVISTFVSLDVFGLMNQKRLPLHANFMIRSLFTSLVFALLLSTGCKSVYEEVRASNDPVRILKTADDFFEKEEYYKAQTLYEQIIPFYRGKKEAEQLFYNYSYTYYHQDQFLLSAYYFNNFVSTFYNSDKREEMAYMSAYSNYLMSPNHKLDQTPSLQAIEELQNFINLYPNSPRVDECNELMDELRAKMEKKSYSQGKLYYDLKSYQSAVSSLENTLKDFPETDRAEEIRYLIIKSSEELARNSIYEKMQRRLEKTIDLCDAFKRKYPESPKQNEISSIIKYCNTELKRFSL